jgi:Sjoegren syndrome nuclear autoantigen 1
MPGQAEAPSFTGEMARTMEELRIKADTLGMEIKNDENLWDKLHHELEILKEQRKRLKTRLAKREAARKEYDKTLIESQTALKKVQDTCTALMGVMRK